MHSNSLIIISTLLSLSLAATSSTTAPAPSCTTGSRIVNNRACWVSCNVTRPGGNYKESRTGSRDACINLCASTPECTTAQYRNDNLFCYLKNVRNQAVVSNVADTIDCDLDYTPTSTNCPVGKSYKLRDAGSNWYANTGGPSWPLEIVFAKGVKKTDATSYQFFIDSRGACGFRPVNTTVGAFLPMPTTPPSSDNGAYYIRYDIASFSGPTQPISCIKTSASLLDCHLQTNIAWDKFQLLDNGSGNTLFLALSTPDYGFATPAVLDVQPTIVLEEV